MKHLVKKQELILSIDAGHVGFVVQQKAREYYDREIMPALEKVFNEISTADEVLYIDSIEIDLGELGWVNENFTLGEDEIYRVLKKQFVKAISLPLKDKSGNKMVEYRTTEENACLQWLYYMENGVLPWPVQPGNIAWQEKVLHQLAIDHELVAKTREKILHDHSFIKRLTGESGKEFLVQLSEVITAISQQGLPDRINNWVKQKDDIDGSVFKQNKIWAQVLKQFALGKAIPDFAEIEKTLNENGVEKPGLAIRDLAGEGIFARYAGLVLLYPFFRYLFDHLLLLENGRFKNVDALEKAVVLLHFIATGNAELMDFDLVVPKIFCGMPLHHVCSEEALLLTDLERAEALNMVDAAISQWEIIRGTSVDGFRETFLEREGKIMAKEQGYEFRMETKGIDVLLDRLPWNLSLVKFSWLEKLIYVAWR